MDDESDEGSESTNLLLSSPSPSRRPGGRAAGAAGTVTTGGTGGVSSHRYRILEKQSTRRGCMAAAYDIAASPGLLPPDRVDRSNSGGDGSNPGSPQSRSQRSGSEATPAGARPIGRAHHHNGAAAAGRGGGGGPQQHPRQAGGGPGGSLDAASGSGSFEGGGSWSHLGRRTSTSKPGEDEWVDVVPSSSPGGWMAAQVGGGRGSSGGGRGGAVPRGQPGPILLPGGGGAVAPAATANGGGRWLSPSAAAAAQQHHRPPARPPGGGGAPSAVPPAGQRQLSAPQTKAQLAAQISADLQIAELFESIAAAGAVAADLVRAAAKVPPQGGGGGGGGGNGNASEGGGSQQQQEQRQQRADLAPPSSIEVLARQQGHLLREYKAIVDACTAKVAELVGCLAEARAEGGALKDQLRRVTSRLEDSVGVLGGAWVLASARICVLAFVRVRP
jgi:hypothetical protein